LSNSSDPIPVPQFDYEMSGLMLSFQANPQHLQAVLDEGSAKTTQKTTQETTRKTNQRILQILRESPEASRRKIAQKLVDITEDRNQGI